MTYIAINFDHQGLWSLSNWKIQDNDEPTMITPRRPGDSVVRGWTYGCVEGPASRCYAVDNSVTTLPYSEIIVWQRFCEPAWLRLAYWLAASSTGNFCYEGVLTRSMSIGFCPLLIPLFIHNCHLCTLLPEKLSVEDYSFWWVFN